MLQRLIDEKNKIGDERDLCAELYNLWITRLAENQEDQERYEMYMRMITMMEPYAQKLKSDMAALNRQICAIEGVESIADTQHVRECNNTHGLDRPNA